MPKIKSLKKLAVKLGYGSTVSEYNGRTTREVLKEIAVKMGIASSIDDIRATTVSGILDYMANNYGDEEEEPYDLIVNSTHATVTIKRNGKTISAGTDILYDGDKLKINVTPNTGYNVSSIKVNGNTIADGDTFVVSGQSVNVVVTTTEIMYTLTTSTNDPMRGSVLVYKGAMTIQDGAYLRYGDTIKIQSSSPFGNPVESLKVNGVDFTDGETMTVTGDVNVDIVFGEQQVDVTWTLYNVKNLVATDKTSGNVVLNVENNTQNDYTSTIPMTVDHNIEFTVVPMSGYSYSGTEAFGMPSSTTNRFSVVGYPQAPKTVVVTCD